MKHVGTNTTLKLVTQIMALRLEHRSKTFLLIGFVPFAVWEKMNSNLLNKKNGNPNGLPFFYRHIYALKYEFLDAIFLAKKGLKYS